MFRSILLLLVFGCFVTINTEKSLAESSSFTYPENFSQKVINYIDNVSNHIDFLKEQRALFTIDYRNEDITIEEDFYNFIIEQYSTQIEKYDLLRDRAFMLELVRTVHDKNIPPTVHRIFFEDEKSNYNKDNVIDYFYESYNTRSSFTNPRIYTTPPEIFELPTMGSVTTEPNTAWGKQSRITSELDLENGDKSQMIEEYYRDFKLSM